MFDVAAAPAPEAARTLILPGDGTGDGPPWVAPWAGAEPGVIVARFDEAHHGLPEVRAFETAHLILANPGAIAVAEGLGATVLVQLLQSWPHLPLAAALLVDPTEAPRGSGLASFGPLPEAALPLPAILYLTAQATSRQRALARAWDCLLAEAAGPGDAPAAGDLPRLRSLRDQLARSVIPAGDADTAPAPGGLPRVPPAGPVPAEVARRGLGRPLPLPRILF